MMVPKITRWLGKNTYIIHSLAFVLMILASLGLFFAARADAATTIWVLLVVFSLANILVLFVK